MSEQIEQGFQLESNEAKPKSPDPIRPYNSEYGMVIGYDLSKQPEGTTLIVKTNNTDYRIEYRPDGTYISGNAKFCPEPVRAKVYSRQIDESPNMLKRDAQLLIMIGESEYITSKVLDFESIAKRKATKPEAFPDGLDESETEIVH